MFQLLPFPHTFLKMYRNIRDIKWKKREKKKREKREGRRERIKQNKIRRIYIGITISRGKTLAEQIKHPSVKRGRMKGEGVEAKGGFESSFSRVAGM